MKKKEQEDEENEPRTNHVEGLYTREEIKIFRVALKRTKCEISDCVFNILPPS